MSVAKKFKNPGEMTSQQAENLTKLLLRKAAEARRDPIKFFDFVMREQTNRMPITAAAHQRVGIKFAMDHDRSVHRWPIGHTKTFTYLSCGLYTLGQDCTTRGAIVSATEGQASKQLDVMADYIKTSPELHLVFPELIPSDRERDPWHATAITIKRPAGIPDPSVVAYGMDGQLPGSRLNWILVDDLLNRENTSSKAQRDKVYSWVDSSVLSRLDPQGGRIIFTNSPWHPDDVMHMLEKLGWPTCRMDILGNIRIQDDVELVAEGAAPWDDGGMLRPASDDPEEECYRLTAHDPDPGNQKPLWFEKFYQAPPVNSKREDKWKAATTEEEAIEQWHAWLARMRRTHLPVELNRLYFDITRDDATAMCKAEWIETCKRLARERGYTSLQREWRNGLVFTGLDLAVSPGEESDDVAFFTFTILPSKHRLLLDIDIGKYDGPTVLDKIVDLVKRYDTTVRVESNAAQLYIKQFMLERDVSAPVKAHMTGRAKAHPEHGVPAIFLELHNGAWLIPNDKGHCHPHVQRFLDGCLYYTPAKHTEDSLMAAYFAREQAREWGALSGHSADGDGGMDLLIR